MQLPTHEIVSSTARDRQPRPGETHARSRTFRASKETYALMVAEIPRLRRYARILVRDVELADDLVQESLARAVARLDSWAPGSNMRAWLFVILQNVHRSHWRRVKRRPATVEVSATDPALAVPGAQDYGLGINDLQAAFDTLSEEHKQILLMIGIEGLQYEDAAEALSLPVGTVRSRLSRARTAVKQRLDATSWDRDLESAPYSEVASLRARRRAVRS